MGFVEAIPAYSARKLLGFLLVEPCSSAPFKDFSYRTMTSGFFLPMARRNRSARPRRSRRWRWRSASPVPDRTISLRHVSCRIGSSSGEIFHLGLAMLALDEVVDHAAAEWARSIQRPEAMTSSNTLGLSLRKISRRPDFQAGRRRRCGRHSATDRSWHRRAGYPRW